MLLEISKYYAMWDDEDMYPLWLEMPGSDDEEYMEDEYLVEMNDWRILEDDSEWEMDNVIVL